MDAVDVHHHIVPDFYCDALSAAGLASPIAGVDYPRWTVEASLAMMQRQGIATAVVSVTVPGVNLGEAPETVRMARRLNEYMADLIASQQGRFGAFAVLPLPYLDAAMAELTYALDVLELDGVGLFTNYRGVYVGDPLFDPLLSELHRRRIAVHVHPAVPPATDQPTFELPASLYEFTFDTTRMAAQLLYNNTLERYPDLRLILSHGGGAIPYLAQRLTFGPVISPQLADRASTDPIGDLQRLHYDVAMAANPYSLPSLRAFVPASQVLVGTDFPFMPEWSSAQNGTELVTEGGYDEDELERIAQRNAAALFPRIWTSQGDTRAPDRQVTR